MLYNRVPISIIFSKGTFLITTEIKNLKFSTLEQNWQIVMIYSNPVIDLALSYPRNNIITPVSLVDI